MFDAEQIVAIGNTTWNFEGNLGFSCGDVSYQ